MPRSYNLLVMAVVTLGVYLVLATILAGWLCPGNALSVVLVLLPPALLLSTRVRRCP